MIHYPNLMRTIFLRLIVTLMSFSSIVYAADNEWVPRLDGRVTDVSNVLTTQDREDLTKMLASYEQETQHQFAVLIIPTLSGESIDSFSLRVANAWKLGQKGLDNGVLVTLAMKERKVRIELGFGMERYISDEKAASIIKEEMTPAFRRGDFASGIKSGLLELMKEGRKYVVPVNKKWL